MKVIFRAIEGQGWGIQRTENGGQVRVQFGFDFGMNEGIAIFGAVVEMIRFPGRWPGLFQVAPLGQQNSH